MNVRITFYRKIPIPEEIVSSKVRAKMSNGSTTHWASKKKPTKLEEEGTTVEIK
jgi:HSP20 family protein